MANFFSPFREAKRGGRKDGGFYEAAGSNSFIIARANKQ